MNLKDKKVLLVGLAKTGISTIKHLNKLGANVVVNDIKDEEKLKDILSELSDLNNVEYILGYHPENVDDIDMTIVSPGVPLDLPFILKLKSKNIEIIGEVELAYRLSKNPTFIGITGTNGKTTTTTLVGEIFKEAKADTYIVGNIGNPVIDTVGIANEKSVLVTELSSFQLESIDTFKPHVSAILNFTEDHLNRHHTMENYAAAKEAIAEKQTKKETCVLNYDNEYTRDFGNRCNAEVVYFSSSNKLNDGYYLEGEDIVFSKEGEVKTLMNIHDMNLVGMCNVENVMAAIAMSAAMGVPYENIISTVKRFKAVEHRIEFVATKNGVDYYNDSKGTNPDAAIQGIRAMSKPTILIGGGYDKENEYDEWIEAFDNKVKLFVLIGQTREKIAECARKHGFDKIVMADTFEEAMEICIKNANSGDAVLLSPACASWGMFPNYEVRGQIFKEIVNGIKE